MTRDEYDVLRRRFERPKTPKLLGLPRVNERRVKQRLIAFRGLAITSSASQEEHLFTCSNLPGCANRNLLSSSTSRHLG